MLEYALNALQHGLCVLPPKEGDKPPCEDWAKYQHQHPTESKLKEWYVKRQMTGIGYVCGKTSGNLEVMDFDIAEYFDHYKEALEGYDTDLADRFMSFVESTPKGMHVYYRCEAVGKNRRLARVGDQIAIETRGEGGYIVAAPTTRGKHAYVQHRGDFSTIPTFSAEERDELHRIARECFDEVMESKPIIGLPPAPKNGSQRPGDAFNAKHDITDVIRKFGWTFRRNRKDGTAEWTRPGSNSGECHATTGHNGIPFYCFSSNAYPLEPDTGYDAFAIFAMYEHGGDFSAAASELSAKGYGDKTASALESAPWLNKSGSKFGVALSDLMAMDLPPMRWVVDGLFPEGCTILAGAPKIGKSWLALDMTLSISTPSRKLFNEYETPHGSVLYLALEDSLTRLQDRTRKIMDGLTGFHPQAAKATDKAVCVIDWPTIGNGCMEQLEEYIQTAPDMRMVIVDTLQRVKPVSGSKSSSNAYEVDYSIVGQFQTFALRHHLAVILITHLRKGNGVTKDSDPFEEVTGSMGISGAADATAVFKRGKNSDMAEFYIRGRDVEEQCIRLKQINGVWHYMGNEADAPAHMDEIREYVAETGKQQVQPAEFNKWYRANFGNEISGIRATFKRLYEAGHIKKVKDGVYALA